MERVPIKKNPRLFDLTIADMQKELADRLGWLDHSFGRAERLVKVIDDRKYYTPNVYVGGNDYLPVSPDAALGNFSFFVLDDPQNVDWQPVQSDFSAPFSVIFWFDMRTITNDRDNRNTEAVKDEIVRALNSLHIRNGSFTIKKIYEQAENIYKGYTLDEVDNQFLMHPYCGFRFTGEMYVSQLCQ